MFSMPNTNGSATLLLCNGKDCHKKQRAAYDRLESAAHEAGLDVAGVPCQGSCVGPTAVVETPDGPRWFENLQSANATEAVVAFALCPSKKPKKALQKRELVGKRRAKAERKLAKAR